MLKRLIVPILTLLFSISLFAYETGKSPNKASLYSFIVPGGGQYYNESPWKTILWGGSEIGFIALTSYHQSRFNDYKDKRDNSTNLDDWNKWDREAGDQLHKRNNGFWWLGSTLILSMLDAYVDASLFDYEEEEKKLNLQFSTNYLGLQFKF